MKPRTFLMNIAADYSNIVKGWNSGAAYEGHVQVLVDDIFRTHLSSRIRWVDHENGAKIQDPNSTGVTLPIPGDFWPKMREIKYTKSNEISDLYLLNDRLVPNATADGDYEIKCTEYYMELKVESKGTGKFGGYPMWDAYTDDSNKLVAEWNRNRGIVQRRRYWMVMIAFSPEAIAELQANGGWTSTVLLHGKPQMFAGVLEI